MEIEVGLGAEETNVTVRHVITGRRVEGRSNENGVFQDDWQSDEDIAVRDGMASDGVERLKA